MMKFRTKKSFKSTNIYKNGFYLFLAWTGVMVFIAYSEISVELSHSKLVSVHLAESQFKWHQVVRMWAASHGGVYIPISEKTPSNPYLSHIKERDVTTVSNKKLTLMNPAYIMRELMELYTKETGVGEHLTSLDPLRPENAPDDWERKALLSFEKDIHNEVVQISNVNGVPTTRFMRPLITEKGCLKCHGHQGYKVGDIRGGISISYPMPLIASHSNVTILTIVLLSTIGWLLGSLLIMYSYRKIKLSSDERYRYESELSEALEFNRIIIEKAPIGFSVYETSGQCIMCNDAIAKFIGATKNAVLAQNFHDIESWKLSGLYEKAINALKTNMHSYIVFSVNSTFMKMSNLECYFTPFTVGNRKCLMLWANDVTHRLAVEREKGTLTMQIEGYNDDLKKLLYIAAHDLRTPLVNIDGFTNELLYEVKLVLDDLLKANISAELTSKIQNLNSEVIPSNRKIIRNSACELDGYLKGILKLSRVVNASAEKKKIITDDLVGSIIKLHKQQIINSNADVVVKKLPECIGASTLLKTVFSNLLSNSLKYTPQGRRCRVEISGHFDEVAIIYVIKDNGVGFSNEVGEKIFNYFYRGRESERVQGSGLGLSIAKWAALKMGGEITFTSTKGVGSSFYVKMPRLYIPPKTPIWQEGVSHTISN